MPDPYRRSIAELLTRYEFEPDLRDIYVEGDRDRLLVGWFFSCLQLDRPTTYRIEEVDVPANLLGGLNLQGNRGRVTALCMELDRALHANAQNVSGLIDKDYSELLGHIPSCRFLLTTDFTCIECYALSNKTLEKFFLLYLGKVISAERMAEMIEILTELFLLRASKISLSATAPWIENFVRCCALRSGAIVFDRADFVQKLLNAAAGAFTQDELEAKVAQLRVRLAPDFRQRLNGHDLIVMLSWFSRQIGVPASISNVNALHRALLTSIELEELQATPLFQRLSTWATT